MVVKMTAEHKKHYRYIRAHYMTVPIRIISQKIGKSRSYVLTAMRNMNLEIPQEIKEQRKKDNYIKKGTIPPNKGKKMDPEMYAKLQRTMFKKGLVPANVDAIGTIKYKRCGSKKSEYYYFIKLADNKWQLYHRFLWESANGPVPNGYIIIFINKNNRDVRLDNLMMISRKENMLRNSIQNLPEELKQSIRALRLLNKKIKTVKNLIGI